MLLANPLYLWDVSFTLSYMGIIAVAIAGDYVKSMGKVGKLSKTLLYSMVIWIIVSPLSSYYFGGISLISPITNIIVVPFLSMVTGLLVVCAILSPTFMGTILGAVANFLLNTYNNVAEAMTQKVPVYLSVARPSVFAVVIMYLFLLLCVIFRYKKNLLKITAVSFSVVCTIYVAMSMNAPAEIIFFDVGQGDASVICVPGKMTAIIDTGPGNKSLYAVVPYIEAKTDKADFLFLTHLDDDHSGGTIEIIKRDLVNQIIISDTTHTNLDKLKEILAVAKECGVPVFFAGEGDKFSAGDDCVIECLYPFEGYEPKTENETSLVLKFVYGETTYLFTGDINKNIELLLLDKNISCDIIKVAHHGSSTSSSLEFINETGADIAIIQAGKDNQYGFPHYEVSQTLSDLNVDVYITGENGAIMIYDDKSNIEVKTFKD